MNKNLYEISVHLMSETHTIEAMFKCQYNYYKLSRLNFINLLGIKRTEGSSSEKYDFKTKTTS